MSRPLLLLTLLAAVLATGLMAWTILGREDPGSRQARDRSVKGERWEAPEGGEGAGTPPEGGGKDDAQAAPEPAAGVRAVVTDPEGRPVAGARVVAWPDEPVAVTADAEGVFLWPPEWRWDIAVYAEGYLPLQASAPVEDGTTYVLTPAARLTGRVVDESGAPVKGAMLWLISPEHVVLDDPQPGRIVTSRTDGSYVFPGVPEGRFDLGARAAGHGIAFERDLVFGTGGVTTRDLVLPRGRAMKVTVLNATVNTRVYGAHPALREMLLPPGGITVLADAPVGRAFAEFPVLSRDIPEETPQRAGETLLQGLPTGPVDVEARDPARITEEGLGSLRDVRGDTVVLELVDCVRVHLLARDVSSGVRVHPRAEYRAGADGPWVEMEIRDDRIRVPLDPDRTRARFVLDGYQTLETDVPAHLSRKTPMLEPEWQVAMVPVGPGETGTLLLEFAPPLEFGDRVGLVARDADGNVGWTGHLTVEEEGKSQRAGPMPTGSWRLSVLATGKIPVVLPNVVVRRGIEETYRVDVSAGGGLEMRVVDEAGELLDEVHILLADPTGQQIDVHVLTMVSEGRGFVSINYLPSAAAARADSGLAPGAYTLTAGREGYAPSSRQFTIQGTEVATVELTLRARS